MHVQTFMVQLSDNNYVYRQNTRTAVRLKVLEMLASVISANSVLYRVSAAFHLLPFSLPHFQPVLSASHVVLVVTNMFHFGVRFVLLLTCTHFY